MSTTLNEVIINGVRYVPESKASVAEATVVGSALVYYGDRHFDAIVFDDPHFSSQFGGGAVFAPGTRVRISVVKEAM